MDAAPMSEKSTHEGDVGHHEVSFATRLARYLRLKPDEIRTFTLETSNSHVTVTLGKRVIEDNIAPEYRVYPGSRSIRIEGILCWRGLEYEVAIDDLSGSGVIGPRDKVVLFDRIAGHLVEGELSKKVYETLIPLIELHVQDVMRRTRRRSPQRVASGVASV